MTAQDDQLENVAEPGEPIDDEAFDDDPAFAPSARQGIGRLTTALLVGIGLVAAFGAGVYAQKQQAPAATGFPGGGRAAFAAGGFPGGAAPGGAGTTDSAGTTASSTGSSSTAAATPSVIGTVVKVSGNTVTVKNFAGKTIKVTVPSGTSITKSSTVTLGDLKAGASVTVTGTTATDGSVAATAVTTR